MIGRYMYNCKFFLLTKQQFMLLTNQVPGLYCELWIKFFPLCAWSSHWKGKKMRMRIEAGKIYLYCVSDGSMIFIYTTQIQIFDASQEAKWVNGKSHFHIQFKVKEVLNLYLLLKLRRPGDKSWKFWNKMALNFSQPYSRIQLAKLTNHSRVVSER